MMTNQVKCYLMVIYHLLSIEDVKRQHRHGIISYHLWSLPLYQWVCVPQATVCDRCKVTMASVRCKQCGPTTFFCDSCTVNHHSDEDFLGNAFHTPEKWLNVRYIPWFFICILSSLRINFDRRFKYPSTLILKTIHECPTQYKKNYVVMLMQQVTRSNPICSRIINSRCSRKLMIRTTE